jgi:hypothetical protein
MGAKVTRIAMLVLGVLACTAPAALGASFSADRSGQANAPFATRGGSGSAGAQSFDLPPFTVACDRVRSTGSVAAQTTSTLSDTLKFAQCSTTTTVGQTAINVAARFEGPLELSYSATNGGATILAPVTIDIQALRGTITIEPGALENQLGTGGSETGGAGAGAEPPFEAQLTPTLKLHSFPTGEQKKLMIVNEQRGVPYTLGQACDEIEPNESGGFYFGETLDEVINGNLSFTTAGGGWNEVKNKEIGEIPFP